MASRARMRDQRGQTAVEYMGVLVIVAVIIAALVNAGLPGEIETMIRRQICAVAKGGDPCTAAEVRRAARRAQRLDRDQDGLSNRRERRLGTDPRKADTDGDGIADADEVKRKLDPRSRDTDRDGISDARELRRPPGPFNNTDPRKADSDGDGLTDGQEAALGTTPGDRDADDGFDDHGDGLSDYEEVFVYGTDPKRQDTDGDGVHDGEEVREGSNALVDERSLGQKVGPEVLNIFLDDPFGGGKGSAVNKLRQGLGKIKDKLRGIFGKAPKEALDDTAENIAAAQRRREAAKDAATSAGRESLDETLNAARVHRGKFPERAGPNDTLVRRDPNTGKPTHYEEYGPDGLPVKRVDLTGREHGGVPTPHVVEFERHVNPQTGEVFVKPKRTVRPAAPSEIPTR